MFFFNHTATTEIYTLSLHDALPISYAQQFEQVKKDKISSEGQLEAAKSAYEKAMQVKRAFMQEKERKTQLAMRDRKSTRLNSSHSQISYAVFCLKKKKKKKKNIQAY